MKNKVNPYVEKRHFNRHPKLMLEDKSEVKPLRTRYTNRWKYRDGKPGPRGGKRLDKFPAMIYYMDGMFYEHKNLKDECDKWFDALVPTGKCVLWDAHPMQSTDERIPVLVISVGEDSRPYEATCDEFGVVWTKSDGIGQLEEWTYLDGRRLPYKRKRDWE